jgi:hypothetical protein
MSDKIASINALPNKTAKVILEQLDAKSSFYNYGICCAAAVLVRAELGHYEYITSGTSSVWWNPKTDNRLSVEADGRIVV